MLRVFTHHHLLATVAILAYITLFYFQTPVEIFFKFGISKLLGVDNPELWRVRFLENTILDFAAIVLLQLIIYFITGSRKYSYFCSILFGMLYTVGIVLIILNIIYPLPGIISMAPYLLFNLTTEPFLTLALLAAYPLFKLDNEKYR